MRLGILGGLIPTLHVEGHKQNTPSVQAVSTLYWNINGRATIVVLLQEHYIMKVVLATTEDICKMGGFTLPGRLAKKECAYQKHQAQQQAQQQDPDEPSAEPHQGQLTAKP